MSCSRGNVVLLRRDFHVRCMTHDGTKGPSSKVRKDEGVRSAERLPAELSRLGGLHPSPPYGSLPLAVHTHTHGLRPFRLRCLFIAAASPSNFFLPPASGAWLARSGTTNS